MENDPHAEVEVDSYYQTCGQLEHMFMLVSCCIRKWSADPVKLLCLALWPCLQSCYQDSRGCYGNGVWLSGLACLMKLNQGGAMELEYDT